MQIKKYLFCNCALEIKVNEPILQERYFCRFLNDFQTADYSFEVIKTDSLPPKTGKCIFDSGENSVYIDAAVEKNYTAFLKGKNQPPIDFACRVNDGRLYISEEHQLNEYSVFEGLRLPELLLHKGIGMLHCSFIEYEGQAILFAGNKQVGKSTQAALWQKYKKTFTVNGDRAGLYFKDNTLFAGGIPYCGMSDICENKNMPVRAIICLSQGAENTIKRLSAFDSFILLLGQFSYNTWDKNAVNNITALVSSIVENVPIFAYSCRKDESAVIFLEEFLKKEA